MNKHAKSNSIRLIAGQWRGRRLPVLDSIGLRPTTDRVRETVFNWLMHDVTNAQCLDLFAGTGALGFECLSRGASFVEFVEADKKVALNIKANFVKLDLPENRARLSVTNAVTFLKQGAVRQFDLVFLDPPFSSDLLVDVLPLLVSSRWLNQGALVYIEQDVKSAALEVPDGWRVYREARAGQSQYALYTV